MFSKLEKVEQAIVVAGILVILGVGISVIHSFDIFWQLQTGRYIWETKSFLYNDTFSLASESFRYEHCWLHDVIFYLTYLLGGYSALSILKGLLISGAVLFATLCARYRGSSYLSIALVLPCVGFASRGGWLARPQLWSFFLFAVFVFILDEYRRRPGSYIWLLIPLIVLWANLHAGSVLAYAVVLAYVVGEGATKIINRPFLFDRQKAVCIEKRTYSVLSKKDYVRLIIVAILILLAGNLIPYEPQFLKSLSSAVESSSTSTGWAKIYNMDWRAPSFANNPYYYYTFIGAAILLCAGWRRISFTDILLLSGLCYMGLGLVRHSTFFYVGVLAIIPLYVDFWLQTLINFKNRYLSISLRLLFICSAIYLLNYYSKPVYSVYGFANVGLREWHYPIEAAEFVKENKLKPNLYNTYDWGGYLMWALFPEYKVFWDGRSISTEMFRNGFIVMTGRPGWDKILDDFDVNTVVTKTCTVDNGARYPIIDRLRYSPDWDLVFADESSLVFVRVDSVDGDWLQAHRLPDSRVDDTIVSEAKLLYSTETRRYEALWEVAQVYLKRKQYGGAYNYLHAYVSRSPHPNPAAMQSYKRLVSMRSNAK